MVSDGHLGSETTVHRWQAYARPSQEVEHFTKVRSTFLPYTASHNLHPIAFVSKEFTNYEWKQSEAVSLENTCPCKLINIRSPIMATKVWLLLFLSLGLPPLASMILTG